MGKTNKLLHDQVCILRLTSSPAFACPEDLSRASVGMTVATVLAITWSCRIVIVNHAHNYFEEVNGIILKHTVYLASYLL